MTQFTIRRAQPGDLDSLVTFNQGIALETEHRELDTATLTAGLKKVLADESPSFYLVATSEDQVAGCLMVTFEWSDWRNAMFWWIQSVYVAKPFRRQGVYRQLYERLKEMAAAENVCGFRLYVEKENTAAQATYESLGMHETVYKMYEETKP